MSLLLFRSRAFCSVFVLGLATVGADAQPAEPASIVALGYAPPKPMAVAPGQIVSLFLATPSPLASDRVLSSSLPLPLELAGFSLVLEQSTGVSPLPIPLLGVFRSESCYGSLPCKILTTLTVQIPWELRANVPSQGRPDNFAVLRVTQEGVATESYPLEPVTDAIHVLSTCEETIPPNYLRDADNRVACRPLITHPNGNLVTPADPAFEGQIIYIHAVGLGTLVGRPATGSAATSAIPASDTEVSFEFGANMAAKRPDHTTADVVFVGLPEGETGVYQIAVKVPAVPGTTPACTASRIESNLTISLGRERSFAGAGLCVQRLSESLR